MVAHIHFIVPIWTVNARLGPKGAVEAAQVRHAQIPTAPPCTDDAAL